MNLQKTSYCTPKLSRFTRNSLLLLISLALVRAATAQTIPQIGLKLGITNNIGLQSSANGALQSGDMAGAPGLAQTNWNVLGFRGDNVLGTTNAVFNVLDSSGANSGITLAWDCGGNWSQAGNATPTAQASTDGNLMNGYSDSNGSYNAPNTNGTSIYSQSSNNKPEVFLSGIRAWLATAAPGATAYDVVVYTDGDVGAGAYSPSGRIAEYWVQNASGPVSALTFGTDITTHVFRCDGSNFITTLTYLQVPNTANAGTRYGIGNYIVFDSLTNDSILIRPNKFGTTRNFTLRSPINAVQIVPRATPLPPTANPGALGVDSFHPAAQATSQISTYPGLTAKIVSGGAGIQPLTYQWQKDGVAMTDGGNISGSSADVLVIANVSATDGGHNYTVIVTNGYGLSVTSAPVALNVLAAPTPGSFAEKIITNNAFAYWRLNETTDPSTGTAVAYDYIGQHNGLYGTAAANGFAGVAGPQPTDWPGFENNNLAFQSANTVANSWITLPPLFVNTNDVNTNLVTIGMWIYPTAGQAASTGLFFSRDNNGDATGFGYGNNNNNNLGYTWNHNSSTTYNFVSGVVPPTNSWSYVSLVVTRTNSTFYLFSTNSFLTATQTLANLNPGDFLGPTTIGADPFQAGRAFSGKIDEVSVFLRALSPTEVYNYYKKGLGLDAIPPYVTRQPVSVQLYAGGTARFSITASGDPPLTYQWRTNSVSLPNGGRVSGATSPNLVITGIGALDLRNYDCVIHGPAGVVTSVVATITMLASPPAGNYVSAVVSNNPYAYWPLNDVVDPTTNGPAVDDAGSLTGTYLAAAQNALGGIAGPQPPAFAGFPANNGALQSANQLDQSWVTVPPLNMPTNFTSANWPGSTIAAWIYPTMNQSNFSGLFTSRPAGDASGLNFGDGNQLGYTWNFNSSATWSFQSGLFIPTNTWSFVVVSVATNQAVLYLCNSNGVQTATNLIAHVPEPFNAVATIGDDSTYGLARSFSGSMSGVAVFASSLNSTQVLNMYVAGLQNSAGLPIISSQPLPETLYSGQTAQPSVMVASVSPVTYQWRKGGNNLSDGGNIAGSSAARLAISNVGGGDVAGYDVIIANTQGSVTSTVANISLAPANGSAAATAILNANPYAYWRFNEAAGPYAYDYWNGHTAVYGNGVVAGTNGPTPTDGFSGFEPGNLAGAYTVGTDQSWVTAAPLYFDTNTLTVAAWIELSGTIGIVPAAIFSSRGGGAVAGLYVNTVTHDLAYTWGTYNAITWDSGLAVPEGLGAWAFVAMSITPSNATLYVYSTNGQASASFVNTHNPQTFTGPTIVGNDLFDATDSEIFPGTIDEVAVFNRALSPTEIAALYTGASASLLPPEISLQPASRALFATYPANFSVLAAGSATLHYQWYRNDVALGDGPTGNGSAISGSGTPNLSISNTMIADGGNYTVVVNNSAGSITSSPPATLLVGALTPDSYAATVVSLNPLAYYRLNEPTGSTVAYDYWGGFNGFPGPATTTGVPGPQNPPFLGLETNNVGIQDTPNNSAAGVTNNFGTLNTNTATFVMWIYPTATEDPFTGLEMNRNGGNPGGFGYTGGHLGYTWNNNNAATYNATWSANLTPPLNQWSFVALVVTPSNAVTYLFNPGTYQGALNANNTATTVVANNVEAKTGVWYIGNDTTGNTRVFAGSIDEVAIWSRSLSATEIQQLYVVGSSGPQTKLTIKLAGSNLILTWTVGTLQTAPTPSGPWSNASSASSPWNIPQPAMPTYWRTQISPFGE